MTVERISHWIGGKVAPGESGVTGPVYNPATGEQTHEVDFASVEEFDRAVEIAKDAFPEWRALSLSKRAALFFRMREILDQRKTDIAKAVTSQHGKCLFDAASEVERGVELLEFAAGLPHLLKGNFSEQVTTGYDLYSVRQPLGVVAGITPFNFPAMVPMWMCAAAMAAGNCFILKPSEKDPGASLLLAEAFRDAGLPDGVFQVVQGDKLIVDRILEHPDIKAVSFVGSTPVAKHIYATGAANGKRVQALAGAKNHMIVLPDADVGMAADAAVSSVNGSAGERCMAIATVVPVGDIAEPLIEAILERTSRLKVGDGMDPENEMGPLVTREHRDRVVSYLDVARVEGAEVLVDGREHPLWGTGFFVGPSVIDHVTEDMTCYKDEIFGPVGTIVRVPTYDDAIALTHRNPWGNGAAIFTRDGGAARQFVFDIEAGMVGINVPIPVPLAFYSFGGWKDSLFGDSKMYGPEGFHFWTREKAVTARWPDPATSGVDLGFPGAR
ncbi:MAG TPA: CoA-acylating methylmalonate-semialdehyde dehydrogenase [Actinomycetota bacterium]|nr:CoA-acylating methylmalonate-semialdehyde dehydrogenase [Actinomycetota bacterium]